ncbi:hypothetical protein BGZ52_000609, partial [Haplosporangium bisporale]
SRRRPRAPPDHLKYRPFEQAQHPGLDPRSEPPLLLNCDQLPQERTGAEDVAELAQEELDLRVDSYQLPRAHRGQREGCQDYVDFGRGIQQVCSGRVHINTRAAQDSPRWKGRSQEAFGSQRGA